VAVRSFVSRKICPACIEMGSGITTASLSSFSECAEFRLTTFWPDWFGDAIDYRIMIVQKPFPYIVIEADQNNIPIAVKVLTEHGITELYSRTVPDLFDRLLLLSRMLHLKTTFHSIRRFVSLAAHQSLATSLTKPGWSRPIYRSHQLYQVRVAEKLPSRHPTAASDVSFR